MTRKATRARSNTPTIKELEAELAKERAETRRADLKAMMQSPAGRRVLFEILYHPTTGLGFDSTPVTCEALAQAGHAAQRACARIWVDRMKAETPELFLEMHRAELEQRAEVQRLREDSLAAEENPDEGAEP